VNQAACVPRLICAPTTAHQLSVSPAFVLSNNRSFSDDVKDEAPPQHHHFDTSLLQFLVCPLSKNPLTYNEKTNELVNEELGIAYPILDGIPNMIPQDARLIQKEPDAPTEPTQG